MPGRFRFKKKRKRKWERVYFFTEFPSSLFPSLSTPTVEFSLCLCCVLFHGVGQVPSHPISAFALHPFFVQCITQVPHFFFEKATRIENGIMAHFPPKIWFKYIFTHFRGLWFKLEYILPRSWFSEGGSGGFHEAQICRKKIINAFSCCFKWFFFVIWPKMSLPIV